MNYTRILLSVSLLAACLSCTGLEELKDGMSCEQEAETIVFSAAIETDRVKTELQSNGSVFWSVDDTIQVFCGKYSSPFYAIISKPSPTAEFAGSIAQTESVFWATYPYQWQSKLSGDAISYTLPSEQFAVGGGFSSAGFPCIAKTTGRNFQFKNICGGAKIQFARSDISSVEFRSLNKDDCIAGDVSVSLSDGTPVVKASSSRSSVTLSMRDGSCFKSGVNYYITLFPAELKSGFELVFKADGEIGTYTYKSPVTIHRSTFGRLIGLDKEAAYKESREDLSANGTSNSYVVNKAGSYKFSGKVKGGSSESVGTPSSAEVLWESFGTDKAPSVGDVVRKVYLDSGYVKFSTPSSLNNGNAVIAVKDSSGNILWSWHIWVCKDFDPVKTAQVYNNNAGTMMDRNLGATSATKGDVHALGLLYQWGRKDPFLGGDKISYSSSSNQQQAASTLSWPSPVSSDSSTGTLAYAVAHPTTFITYNSSNFDWYYTGTSYTDNTRWQTYKGVYDPCPQGWRVPDGGEYGVWSKAFGRSLSWTRSSDWDSTNLGMDFGKTDNTLGTGTIWYPAAGDRSSNLGSLSSVGSYGASWSCTPLHSSYIGTYFLSIRYDGRVNPTNGLSCALGQSVRCLKEDNVQ